MLTKFSCRSLKFLVHIKNAQKIRENVPVGKTKSAYVIYEWPPRTIWQPICEVIPETSLSSVAFVTRDFPTDLIAYAMSVKLTTVIDLFSVSGWCFFFNFMYLGKFVKVHRHCFPTNLVKLMRIINVLLYISFPVPVTNLGKKSNSIKLKIRGIRAWNSLRWLKFWFISLFRFRLLIWIFWFILILRNWKFVKVDCYDITYISLFPFWLVI